MKSLQHVLWRGALALSLMAIGVGSGVGMPPAEQTSIPGDCPIETGDLVADEIPAAPGSQQAHDSRVTLIVLRDPLSPAG